MTAAYLILNNVSKAGNFGTIIRSAAAMGIQDIFVVGAEKLRTFGNQNTLRKCRLHYWDSLTALRDFLHGRNVEICGIEIAADAQALSKVDFTGKATAFMLGNEGSGMNEKQKEICDRFVYIEHFSGATASLNVAVAGGIVFHKWAIDNQLPEHEREGQKYVVCTSGEEEFEDLSQPNRDRRYHRHPPVELEDVNLDFDNYDAL